jgi:hypothetical protein
VHEEEDDAVIMERMKIGLKRLLNTPPETHKEMIERRRRQAKTPSWAQYNLSSFTDWPRTRKGGYSGVMPSDGLVAATTIRHGMLLGAVSCATSTILGWIVANLAGDA